MRYDNQRSAVAERGAVLPGRNGASHTSCARLSTAPATRSDAQGGLTKRPKAAEWPTERSERKWASAAAVDWHRAQRSMLGAPAGSTRIARLENVVANRRLNERG